MVIKMPDGTLNIGTESKDKQIVSDIIREYNCVERGVVLELQKQIAVQAHVQSGHLLSVS